MWLYPCTQVDTGQNAYGHKKNGYSTALHIAFSGVWTTHTPACEKAANIIPSCTGGWNDCPVPRLGNFFKVVVSSFLVNLQGPQDCLQFPFVLETDILNLTVASFFKKLFLFSDSLKEWSFSSACSVCNGGSVYQLYCAETPCTAETLKIIIYRYILYSV